MHEGKLELLALSLKQAKGISLDDTYAAETHQMDDLILNSEQPLVFLKAEKKFCNTKTEMHVSSFCSLKNFLPSDSTLLDLSAFICLCYTFGDEAVLKLWEFMCISICKQILKQKQT